jgi:hypothetical protein
VWWLWNRQWWREWREWREWTFVDGSQMWGWL